MEAISNPTIAQPTPIPMIAALLKGLLLKLPVADVPAMLSNGDSDGDGEDAQSTFRGEPHRFALPI